MPVRPCTPFELVDGVPKLEAVDTHKWQEWETMRRLDSLIQEGEDLLLFRRFEKLRRYELLCLQQQLADMIKSLVKEGKKSTRARFYQNQRDCSRCCSCSEDLQ